jgi:hypothetical protein
MSIRLLVQSHMFRLSQTHLRSSNIFTCIPVSFIRSSISLFASHLHSLFLPEKLEFQLPSFSFCVFVGNFEKVHSFHSFQATPLHNGGTQDAQAIFLRTVESSRCTLCRPIWNHNTPPYLPVIYTEQSESMVYVLQLHGKTLL